MSCLDFLDLKKAFVLVDHDILSKKLAILVKNSCSRPLSKSYLDNRMHFLLLFLLHESYFSEDSVKFGVPQASIFGPSCLDFLLFLNLLLMTFHYATCWPMTQHCTHLEKTLYKPEAILYKTA